MTADGLTQTLIDRVLARPWDHQWTIQGFGMLRTYLDSDEVHRLHIWDTSAAVPDVSVIHDHPWDFDSRIVYGSLVNVRYELSEAGDPVSVGRIKTGEGGGLLEEVAGGGLLATNDIETLWPGDSYHMDAPELHESMPSLGCVSVISRRFHTTREDQHATVCWRSGDWVSAEPRKATALEVAHFLALAKAAKRS